MALAGSVAGLFALQAWLGRPDPVPVVIREPGRDVAPGAATSTVQTVDLKGFFKASDGRPSAIAGQWPWFRGADHDNIAKDSVPLAEAWPTNGPPVLWTLDLGEGHAGPAVRAGRVYLLDYDEAGQADVLRCLSLDDGREIWSRGYKVRAKRNHGISRTVPAVTERFVVSIGPRCHVLCADALTGEFRWGLDLVREYGTKEPLWYTGQCPLILDGTTVILAPGGRALLVAVDVESGRVLWETPNPDGWQMSHASVMPITLGGRRCLVYCAIGGVVGVAADGADRGKVLWSTTEWNNSVTAPCAVGLGDGRLLVTAGYGAGSMMLQVTEAGGAFACRSLFRLGRDVFACEQQTPIWYDSKLYTVLPNDAGAHRRELVCMDPDGAVRWTSGAQDRFGLGPFLVADGKIFVLDDSGVLTLARATAGGYARLARARILDGRDAWGPMALVDGRLILRDWKKMVCLDVRAGQK